jgi:uncharacterized protein (TIGR03435 family)
MLAAVVLAAAALRAQGAPSRAQDLPRFEVASIKRNTSGDAASSFNGRPGQITVRNNTLRNIIRNLYNLRDYQIAGGPAWLDVERFDIVAKAADDRTPQPRLVLMMIALLSDRFGLVVHREMRDMPIYALTVARADRRLGPALMPGASDCLNPAAPQPQVALTEPVLCGTRTLPGRMLAAGVTMADLSRNLSNFAGRVVLDRTGLSGRWNFELRWLPDPGLQPPVPPGVQLPAPDRDAPSLFTALQEQLGLKLDAARGPVEMLVIDTASPPTPD